MGLSFVNPNGFRFFVVCNAIALLILSMVRSVVDILPPVNILRFVTINLSGMLLFVGSIRYGRQVTQPKLLWFINAFTAAGLILIVYSSSVEIVGVLHVYVIPFVHMVEVAGVIWIANTITKEDERERYAELTHFPTPAGELLKSSI